MQITSKEQALLNINEAMKKIASPANNNKECWFNLVQKSIKVISESIASEDDL